MGLDAIWADDFHHVVRVMLTGMREGYFKSYRGTVDELAATLEHGWLLAGEERARAVLGQPGEADGVVAGASSSSASPITTRSGITLSGLRLNQLISAAGLSRRLGAALPRSLHAADFHGTGMGRLYAVSLFHRPRIWNWVAR